MATIEPRLIHLLNNSQTPDLPPIQLRPLGAAAGQSLSLPPLKPDLTAGHSVDRPLPTQVPPRYNAGDDHAPKPVAARPDDDSGLLTASIRPLQLLLTGAEPSSTIPLRMILDDVPPTPSEEASTRTRPRLLPAKEDFVQLPQPPKKQKSAVPQVVPPIIAGLQEPPPDPAVFPPITSAPFDHGEPLGVAVMKELKEIEDRPAPFHIDVEKHFPPRKRRAMKPRKKWSEEETNNLLLGVSRHGVGRWTSILEDPDFKFNGRTAGDLKDRFRTCCPEELRVSMTDGRPANGDTGSASDSGGKTRPRNGCQLEDILIPTENNPAGQDAAPPSASQDVDAPKRRKSRAHRKKLEDLAELGIHGPFERSSRRKRRAFTRQDDRDILDGLQRYGPSWTRIQRDPKYNLSTRQPTDLRDRVRNKYPDIYSKIEKANLEVKEAARARSSILDLSVNNTTENGRSSAIPPSLEPPLNQSASKEDMSRRTTTPSMFEPTESLPGLADLFDMNETAGPSFFASSHDIDISHLRLLLDNDSHPPAEHLRCGGAPDALSNRASPTGVLPDPRFAHDR